ncbi:MULTISPECIES: flagellin [unclassified Thalassolituus]|jgi:flagellin|uniref:flagellin N-terminal helical domain-containing protein n=1 Tax=Oceanospirillaceae TaxID=135620 RepID=UPI0011932B40|nr:MULTISPECIES: flagellin [unclassified Thalassolituus]MCA6061899.1 hypothetical protein [Thalassolituus sp. ST750PaO-4]TVV45334.1 hypothetical protein FOT50_00405 [Thalassolituus sp. C2-1]
MPQIINTNIASINAQRNLDKSQSANQQALQRLSSGLRINSAKDDAAGLAISTRFTSQIKGLNVAVRNAGDGIALAQTAEGALGSMNDNLQRIRELAVQSANATNSDVDREALQAEVDQLVAEISRTADETDFNGRKLLDGSFKATFQIGANAGQTVDVSIAELTASKLGSSKESGISAIGTDNALANGDLIINGVAITASRAEDDSASTSGADASAISKAAAVNRHSAETGVSAQVNENTVSGSEMTASAASGTISLNGVNIDIQTSNDGSTTRASVLEAINAVSDQTGVVAVDTGFDKGGVQLVAADGRNVDINLGTLSAAQTGLAATGVYEGGFTLIADGDVKEIVIEGGNGTGNGDLSNAGLVAGTYESGQASVVSDAQTQDISAANATPAGTFVSVASAAASGFDTTTSIGYEVTVNGATSIGTMASGGFVNNLAAAISNVAGVTAYESVKLTVTMATTATAIELGTGTSGAMISFTAGSTATVAAQNAADAINARDFSAENLDVSATVNSAGALVLDVKNFSTTTAGSAGLVVFDTSGAIGNVAVGTNAAAAFQASGTNNIVQGSLAFQSDDGTKVTVALSDPDDAGQLLASGTTSVTTAYDGVNGLKDGDLTINGVSIKAAETSEDKASAEFASDGSRILSSNKTLSGIAVAAAINEVSDETGVQATVNPTEVVGGTAVTQAEANAFENGDQAGIYINGVSLGSVTLQTDSGGNIDYAKSRADAIALINQSAGQTGVTAIDNGESISLTAADGRNISIAIDDKSGSSSSIGRVFGLDSAVEGIGEATFGQGGTSTKSSVEADTYETTYSTVKLTSAKEIEVNVGSNGNTELEALGFNTGTYGGGENGQFLTEIDISTFEGATAAITAIDNAIGQVASQRADLGAIQNRMSSTVSNLQVTSENLNSANSRIQDADFAAETAELSRTQVLQQAGISVLAQANAAGQQVLSLLG